MIKIWGRTDSSNVQKVLWCCAELGIDFERVDWGGKFGGNNDKAYREMNPNGLVPTITDGDFILWESNSIMRYLNVKYGGGKLLPAAPEGMANANWILLDYGDVVFNVFQEEARKFYALERLWGDAANETGFFSGGSTPLQESRRPL